MHPLILMLLVGLPTAIAVPDHDPFPNIPFRKFSQFVDTNFSSNVSLATVLVFLLTTTSNPDLFNLHARQQHPMQGEIRQAVSGWIKALARALRARLGDDADKLFKSSERESFSGDNQLITSIGSKLNDLSKLLGLDPYGETGHRKSLRPVSEKDIMPVYVICPVSMECQTKECNGRALHFDTRERDIPRVTLIKGTTIYDDIPTLHGKCRQCDTIYHADHESSRDGQGRKRFYLNSAKYLKVGQQMWVDRTFSAAVLNGTYSFHASSAAFAEFWNDSYWATQEKTHSRKISRQQVWHAFVQESLRRVAESSGNTLVLEDGLAINEVTRKAFEELGEEGVIRSAQGHYCSECTHEYKDTADRLTGDDPAALLGIDDNRAVPVLVGDGAELAAQEAAQARQVAEEAAQARNAAADRMDIDEDSSSSGSNSASPIKMVVLDGIVMGPTVSVIHLNPRNSE